MIELSVVRDLVAIFGVIAGFSYYVMTVQSQKKNQRLSAAHKLLEEYNDTQMFKKWNDMMNWKWNSIQEFWENYGDQENQSKFVTMAQYFDGVGFLWDTGVIDRRALPLFDAGYLILWRKYKPIIEDMRENWYTDWCTYWEKLAVALDGEIGDKIGKKYTYGWM